jgi:hypothetical protein
MTYVAGNCLDRIDVARFFETLLIQAEPVEAVCALRIRSVARLSHSYAGDALTASRPPMDMTLESGQRHK